MKTIILTASGPYWTDKWPRQTIWPTDVDRLQAEATKKLAQEVKIIGTHIVPKKILTIQANTSYSSAVHLKGAFEENGLSKYNSDIGGINFIKDLDKGRRVFDDVTLTRIFENPKEFLNDKIGSYSLVFPPDQVKHLLEKWDDTMSGTKNRRFKTKALAGNNMKYPAGKSVMLTFNINTWTDGLTPENLHKITFLNQHDPS